MSVLRRLWVFAVPLGIFVLGLWLGAVGRVSGNELSRTEYESFALETPETAVQTFVDTFHRSNFAGLFLILAPSAQLKWKILFTDTFDPGVWVQPDKWDIVREDVAAFALTHPPLEHDTGLADYVFDEVMASAEKHDALLIDLRGNVTILNSQSSQTANSDSAEDVLTTVEGIEGQVTFRMVQAPSQRWRVYQVIVPGGNERLQPWAIPYTFRSS